ncbi:hypothetical protein LJC33_07960 [Eubacteriales bacterium OttesenSCG-928-N13]|nr:hypothetical protein [Eubacteriales bacterium OttesenSCG-928-N13]
MIQAKWRPAKHADRHHGSDSQNLAAAAAVIPFTATTGIAIGIAAVVPAAIIATTAATATTTVA